MTGLRDQLYPMEYAPAYRTTPPPAATQRRVTFNEVVIDHWPAVELDFHTEFRADFESGILRDRTWRWFVMRVGDLIENPRSRVGSVVRATTTE